MGLCMFCSIFCKQNCSKIAINQKIKCIHTILHKCDHLTHVYDFTYILHKCDYVMYVIFRVCFGHYLSSHPFSSPPTSFSLAC